MAEQSLKDKTVKGVAWSSIDNIVQFSVSFVVSIVLARLLSPEDYGLIGIITIFTAVCAIIINGGFNTALIRKKDATEDDYNTVFIVNLIMSLLLYALVFASSPLIADFFSRKELIALTRVSSFGMVIGALALVQQARLTKQIDFKTQAQITFYASIGSGLIGIIMAFMGLGVWALVAQGLTNQLFKTILLWYYNKWIPQFRFSIDSFHDLFGFGWKMMVSGLLDAIWKELYQVVVGKFYSPATLGQYTRAKQFSTLFSSNLTYVVQRVSYPVLSNIQDDKRRMISAYRRIIKTTMFITVISSCFLAAVSEPLLFCLIGPQWHEAATYLPLICISASLYPLNAINCNMMMVQGRSDLLLGLEVIKKIIAICPLCVGALIGVLPMLYVNLLTSVIAFFLNSSYSGRWIGYNSWMQLKDVAPSYGVAFFVAIVVWPLKYLLFSNWIILPLQFLIGVITFLIVCRVAKINEYKDIMQLITQNIPFNKKKNKNT